MTVYVDDMKMPYGRMIMSHMIADSDDELKEVAMVCAGTTLFRLSVMSWVGIAPGASHLYGQLEDTESGETWMTDPCDTEAAALLAGTKLWTEVASVEDTRLLVGFSQSAVCQLPDAV